MSVAECEVLTLGDPDVLEHFIYVSDYGHADASVMLVCENEGDALLYLKLFSKLSDLHFSVRMPVYEEWDCFNAEAAKMGLICRHSYDMIYPGDSVFVPEYNGVAVRTLCENDMPALKAFCDRGGCAACHIQALRIAFEGKGNIGMKPVGIFEEEELICLALPTLDKVRDFRKYDIGGIFTVGKGSDDKYVELIWKFVIDFCLKDNAAVGNSNAYDDCNDPCKKSFLGVVTCERMGLVKTAKTCVYRKR